MDVRICRGLGADEQYYVSLDVVTVVISRVGLFKLGLAFYHVAVGNWQLDDVGGRVEGVELRVVGGDRRISPVSSVSANRHSSGQNHTPRWVEWLLFETTLGGRVLGLLERVLGLAVVDSGWLGSQ
mgnify:CR=1 FL=1